MHDSVYILKVRSRKTCDYRDSSARQIGDNHFQIAQGDLDRMQLRILNTGCLRSLDANVPRNFASIEIAESGIRHRSTTVDNTPTTRMQISSHQAAKASAIVRAISRTRSRNSGGEATRTLPW